MRLLPHGPLKSSLRAASTFSRIPSGDNLPDSQYVSALLRGLCAAGRFAEARHRLVLAVAAGRPPDDRTVGLLLSSAADSSPDDALCLLAQLTAARPAFVLSAASYNRLIHRLCSISRPADAEKLLLDMKTKYPHRPNTVSYTAVIDGYARAGNLDSARRLFDEMPSPNSLTHSSLVKAVLRKRMIEEGRRMMEQLWEKMADDDPSMRNAAFANVVDSLCKEGFFQELFNLAENVPNKICVSQEFAYGQMIDSLCRVNQHHAASRVIYIMKKGGLNPSLVSYNNVVHGLSKKGEGGCLRAYQLFEEGMRLKYSPPLSTYKSLIDGLFKIKHVQKAITMAEFMLEKKEADTLMVYNILLSSLRFNPSEQLNVLVWMLNRGCKPDVVTLNTIVHGFCMAGKIDESLKILQDMQSGEFCAPDVVTFTTVIHGLVDAGRPDDAFEVLNVKMKESSCLPNIVTYNSVLGGLCKLGKVELAMDTYKEMVKSVRADCRTWTILLDGLLGEGRVDDAKAFWDDVVWPSGIHDGFVYSAVLRGLCKLGRVEEACDFLYELIDCGLRPGIVCYNILIDGAVRMKLKRQAYRLVEEMRRNGLSPDAVTWRILDKIHRQDEVIDNTSSRGEVGQPRIETSW